METWGLGVGWLHASHACKLHAHRLLQLSGRWVLATLIETLPLRPFRPAERL
jgi:hypothetical protein